MILTPGQLRMFEALRPMPRRSFPGQIRGERLTKRKGISIEFADYRDYAAGDDLRHLDWNVLARLESPVIKTYQDEVDLSVYVLLDCSRSMDFGEATKFCFAVEAAAALGFCALCAQDAVSCFALGLRNQKPPIYRSRVGYPKLDAWLASRCADGVTGLSASLRDFASVAGRTGIALILSDGLDPDTPKSVRALSARGFEVWFIQVLSPIEIDPDLEGDLKLIDSETGVQVEITANGEALDLYKKNLERHCTEISEACRKGGGRYALHRAGDPIGELVKRTLQREGWLAA